MAHRVLLPTLLLGLSCARAAAALEPAPRPDRAQLPAEGDPARSAHDGFYLRVGVGLGSSFQSATTDDEINGSALAAGGAGELAIGAALRPGLLLGGGVWASINSWTIHSRRDEHGPFDLGEVRDFALLGVMVDHYPLVPSGFHAQLGVGLAELGAYTRWRGQQHGRVGLGGGLMLGVGYETPLERDWSIGVLGRLTAALTRQLGDRDVWLQTTVPGVLITATYD